MELRISHSHLVACAWMAIASHRNQGSARALSSSELAGLWIISCEAKKSRHLTAARRRIESRYPSKRDVDMDQGGRQAWLRSTGETRLGDQPANQRPPSSETGSRKRNSSKPIASPAGLGAREMKISVSLMDPGTHHGSIAQ